MNNKTRRLLFFANCAVFSMAASFAHPVTPTIFKDLNLASYMFGVALAAMMTVNFLVSPFWGKINGYISSRNSLLISCVGYAIGQLMFGLAQSEMAFIGARMFAGIFTGGTFVSMLTYIVNTSKDEPGGGKSLTIYATIQAVFGAFGYFVGGMIGEFSVYAAVAAQVLVLALTGVGFRYICLNDRTEGLPKLKPKAFVREVNPFKAFADSRQFMTGLLMSLFIMCALQNLTNTAFDQSFNYYIKDVFNFTSGYNGMIKGVMGLITLVANSTICMWIIGKTNVKKSLITVFAIGTVTLAGVVLLDSIVPFIIANVCFFAINGMSIPMLQNIVARSAQGNQSNLVMGFYNSMKSLGGIFGALLSGVLYTVNPKFPFIFGLLALATAAMMSVIYYKKSEKPGAV